MKLKFLLAGSAAVLIFQMPWNAQAFECPKHFAEAQTLIEKVKGDMGGAMSKQMPKEQMALVHSVVVDVMLLLSGG